MGTYDQDLLDAAENLTSRRAGQRGKLTGARAFRRPITRCSTSWLKKRPNGSSARTAAFAVGDGSWAGPFTHSAIKIAMEKVRGSHVESTIDELFRSPDSPSGPLESPVFVQNMARTFLDTQAKRHTADYDLNESLSEADATLLRLRVKRTIADWRTANHPVDRDTKHMLCILMLLKGQLRREH